jgi:hypothetical protein
MLQYIAAFSVLMIGLGALLLVIRKGIARLTKSA